MREVAYTRFNRYLQQDNIPKKPRREDKTFLKHPKKRGTSKRRRRVQGVRVHIQVSGGRAVAIVLTHARETYNKHGHLLKSFLRAYYRDKEMSPEYAIP